MKPSKSGSMSTPSERADLLFRVAATLRERKHEMSAWMIHEVGKTWPEADGDTAEAIDFCEFYGREMLRYASPPPLTKVQGEENLLEYIPLGVGAVIPPWNFPLSDHGGHDRRFSSHREHRSHEAFFRCADHRL